MSYDLAEIEKRLQMAAAYRKLVDYKVLTGTEVDDIVTDEVRDFAKGRLEVLLGVRADAESAAHFTTTEVLALKALARKLLEPKSEQSSEEEVEESPVVVAPKKRVQKASPAPKTKAQKQQKVIVTAPPPEPEPEEYEDDNVKDNFEDAEVGDIVVEGNKRYEIIEIEGKKFPKDITKQAISSDRKPMPNLELAMQQLAYESLAASSDPVTQALIAASMGT